MLKRGIIAVVLLWLGAQDKAPTLAGIPDAWPERERTAAQRFGMKTIENLPVPELEDDPGQQEAAALVRTLQNRNAWRVVGVKVSNPATTPLAGKVVLPQVKMEQEVTVPPLEWIKVFFVVRNDPALKTLRYELRKDSALLAGGEMALGKSHQGAKWQAALVADELRHEQEMRPKWTRRPAQVETLADAKLSLLHKKLGMRVSATTDAKGQWRGDLLVGEWLVYVRKIEVKAGDPTPTKDGTTTTKDPSKVDLHYLAGEMTVGEEGGRAQLVADRHSVVKLFDGRDAPVRPERISFAPADFTPALRHELVHGAVADLFMLRFDTAGTPMVDPVLHSTSNLVFEVQAWAVPSASERLLFTDRKAKPDKELVLRMKGAEYSQVILDPASLPGGDQIDASLSMPDGSREIYSLTTKEKLTLRVPSGPLRLQVNSHAGQGTFHFTPEVSKLAPGQSLDLSPRNLVILPHWQDFRGLMVWVCVMDSLERFVTKIDNAEGTVKATLGPKLLFEQKLTQLTFHFPDQFKDVPWAGITYTVALNVGKETLRCSSKASGIKEYSDPPAAVILPEKLKNRAHGMIPMIDKTLTGCLGLFGFPKFNFTVEVVIRMPPELPMLAMGGKIQVDLSHILDYADETDTFNRTYPHELGHCLGFGHDSYMAIAYHGCDEGLLGWPGYLLLYGTAPEAILKWLDRDRDAGEWSPSGNAYAILRMLYGPTVHKRMFELRTKFGTRLEAAGFSVEERIATCYSEACGENLAWIFRALGWPVFDYRVRLGMGAMHDQSLAGEFKYPAKIDGTFLTTWWMRGPIALKNGKADALPAWKIHQWPGRFLRLADEDQCHQNLAYHMYLTLGSQESRMVILAISTDSQVDLYLDGQRVTRVFAAPQKTQPAHDDYTLGRVQATRVPLLLHEGANALELVVVKPPGSKGMFIELASQAGKPVPNIGHDLDKGPDELAKADGEKVDHGQIPAIYNASFEAGKGVPDAWIMATKDGDGNVLVNVDDKIKAHGERSLRIELDNPVRGAVIQRCIVEEDSTYEFSGVLHAEGLKGDGAEAFVMLFWGRPEEGSGFAHSEILTKDEAGWKPFKVKWRADRRAVYVGCVLRGGAGAKAWFDNLALTKLKQ